MSITFALIPLALAYAAHKAAQENAEEAGHHALDMQTRMKDRDLLAHALTDLGCTAAVTEKGVDATRADGTTVRFVRDADDILQVTFEEGTEAGAAAAFLKDVDGEYTRLVQEQVYQRLMARASAHGMVLENERVEADNSIVVTLKVDA